MAKKLSDMDKRASLKALGDFRGEAQKLMKDKMNGLKKVTVASDSKEGLKEGLEKAESLLKKGSDMYSSEQANDNFEDRDEHALDEMEEMDEDEMACDLSEDELDKKIQELMAMKSKMKK